MILIKKFMKTKKIFFINIFLQNCNPVVEKIVYKEKDNEINDKIEQLTKRVNQLEAKNARLSV